MERRSGVIVFILSMSLLFRFTHEKRLERESPNWGLEPMINGEPTMRWSGKITPFNIPLTNEYVFPICTLSKIYKHAHIHFQNGR